MKYTRLSKEQLENLHEEFINFLASQTITAKEWETIKKETPSVAEDELDIFSDLIWEGALTKAQYLENASAGQLFLFELGQEAFNLIHIKVTNPNIDLTTTKGITWLSANLSDNAVQITRGQKQVGPDRNAAAFELIQQGAQITTATLYTAINGAIHSK